HVAIADQYERGAQFLGGDIPTLGGVLDVRFVGEKHYEIAVQVHDIISLVNALTCERVYVVPPDPVAKFSGETTGPGCVLTSQDLRPVMTILHLSLQSGKMRLAFGLPGLLRLISQNLMRRFCC